MLSTRVQAILDSIQSLKPLPSSVTRILKEIDNPQVTAGRMAEYIGQDQALAALVLQMSNSASLGYRRTCTSINDAVMRLGFKRLKSILLTSSASNQMSQNLVGYRQGAGELWQHSLMIAVTAEWLAQELRYKDPEEAYVSGLLHDFGKLLLDQFILADYNEILMLIHTLRLPLWQVEEKRIGISHAKVGGMVAEKWTFPPVLVDTIQYHHNPAQAAGNATLPAIINLANHIGSSPHHSDSSLVSSELHPDTPDILHLSDEDIIDFQMRIQAKLEAME